MPNKICRRAVLQCASIALLAAPAPSFADSHVAIAPSATWSQTVSGAASISATSNGAFFVQIQSAELDRLISHALGANPDIESARAAIDLANAQLKIARASLFPNLDASANAQSTRVNSASAPPSLRAGSLDLSAAYQVDLFGANASSARAARARVAASTFDRQALTLSIENSVAQTYLQAEALTDRIAYARQSLDDAQQLNNVVQARVREGANSALDAAQQQGEVDTQQAQLAALIQSRQATVDALAVLTGQNANVFTLSDSGLSQLSIPSVALAQPAAMVTRRPDLAAAEARIAAANGDVAAARAAMLPQINLTSGALATAAGLHNPIAATLSIGAGILAPIFDGGRLRGEAESASAAQRESLDAYRKAVLVALQESEDALSSVSTSQQRATVLADASAAAAQAVKISREQYEAGAVDFTTVLDSQRALATAQDSAAQAKLDQFDAAIALFQALGGAPQQ